MKYDDVKIGEYYKFSWPLDYFAPNLVFVVGRDPFTGRYVATCKEWLNHVDLLDDEDISWLEPL